MKGFLTITLVSLTAVNIANARDVPCSPIGGSTQIELQKKAERSLSAHDYSRIKKDLRSQVLAHPEACQLTLLLGLAYLYSKDDKNATVQFRGLLARDPQNRRAKLELARIYGYHSKYARSNQLYRELLATDSSDEPASIGLVRNLIRMKKLTEANAAINAGLSAHPNSLRLQEYKDDLSRPLRGPSAGPAEAIHLPEHDVQNWSSFVSDSAGDRIVENSSRMNVQLSQNLFARAASNFRHLSSVGTVVQAPDGNTDNAGGAGRVVATQFDASARFDYHLRPWLTINGGGGGIRFDDGASQAIFQSGFEVQPKSTLYLDATYLRFPVLPTQRAATYDLTAQGLRTSIDWLPPQWRLHLDTSELKYTDGNLRHRQDLEVIRWFGTGPVNIGAGYRGSHFTFSKVLNHGYFSPDTYQSHTGIAAVRVRYPRKFYGEYRVNAGGESISGLPFRVVYELSAQNYLRLRRWDIHADYTFYHFTQSTGAFQTNLVILGFKYHF
jgi:hypothetical protein